MITADEKRATLLTLYPLFKEEVYRRREQMMRWTVIGAGSLFTILSGVLLFPEARRLPPAGLTVLACAILLLSATFASLIFLQQQRHRQAKETLIELEKALGLYDQDLFLHRRSLYPGHWQTDWMFDPATTLSFVIVGLFTLLALAATLLVP